MDWNLEIIALGEILLAMALGGLVGFEREMARKPAGLRTHMLVCGSAALLVTLGNAIVRSFDANAPIQNLQSDPIRVIEAIIVGISFLGAGTIFRRERANDVEGLTTAASILFTAGIGIAVATSQFVLAIGGVILLLFVNRILGLVENRFFSSEKKRDS
jgi:putative Mg2+ transporter-C (MgtC) family protein